MGRMGGEVKHGVGKTGYRQEGFDAAAPIPCGDGGAPCVVEQVSLGSPLDATGRLSGIMIQVEVRGRATLRTIILQMGQLGLPMRALLQWLRYSVRPKVCYAAPLLIARGDWRKRLDA